MEFHDIISNVHVRFDCIYSQIMFSSHLKLTLAARESSRMSFTQHTVYSMGHGDQ
jgi:hypothetical protein